MKRAMIAFAALAFSLSSAFALAQGPPRPRPAPAPAPRQQPAPPVRPEAARPADPQAPQSAERGKSAQAGEQKTVAAHLARNTKLTERIQADLPAGSDVQQAAAGFEHLGHFISTVQASKNLNIPFDDLKARVTSGKSLGDAIHELKPDVDHKAEAQKARQEADRIIRESGRN